jgi:hypothetical protein
MEFSFSLGVSRHVKCLLWPVEGLTWVFHLSAGSVKYTHLASPVRQFVHKSKCCWTSFHKHLPSAGNSGVSAGTHTWHSVNLLQYGWRFWVPVKFKWTSSWERSDQFWGALGLLSNGQQRLSSKTKSPRRYAPLRVEVKIKQLICRPTSTPQYTFTAYNSSIESRNNLSFTFA